MCVELKIKSKHLALEPAIIRTEELKLKKQYKWERANGTFKNDWKLHSLTNHRKIQVRNEARSTFLARAYIKGIPYKSLERSFNDTVVRNLYVVPRVLAMVQKYHNRRATKEDIMNWINE